MHLPHYKSFKREPSGEYVWLTLRERFLMWLGDRLHSFGRVFTLAAERIWKKVA